MNKTKILLIFWVALSFMINGSFHTAIADHDEHKEKRWYHKILDRDDDDDHDDDHDRGGKRSGIEKGIGMIPKIIRNAI